MIDTEAKLFWDRLKEWFWNMADEAGNLIYTDESKEMVDIINLLLLGWILLGLIVYILGNIIATQLRKRKQKELVTPTSESVSPYTTDTIAKSESVSSPVEDVPFEVLDDDIAVIKSKSSHVPVCSSGDSKFVSWINDVLSWVYSRGVVSPIREAWLSALNARTRMSSMEHGFLIDFKDIIPSSQAPDFVDVFAVDSEGMKELIHCQANARTLGFEVEVTQFKEKEKNTFPVILNVKELSGKLGIDVYPEDLLFTIKLLESPQVKVELDAGALDSFPVEDRTAVQDVICDIVNDAISTAVVQIRLSSYSECPRISSYQRSTETEMVDPEIKGTEERLLVKVVKAENLGSDKGCLKPYCIIEMDDPPQKFETSEAEHETSPIWNESFVFTVKEVNAELLFEIYDKERKDDFLGLGIVSLEELLRNPNQKLTIPLQERPLENDLVTGTLTAEFLFLDRNDSESTQYHSDLKNEQIMKSSKIVETNSRVTAGGTVITTTTIKRTNEENVEVDKERNKFTSELTSNLPNAVDIGPLSNYNITPMTKDSFIHAGHNEDDLMQTDNFDALSLEQNDEENANSKKNISNFPLESHQHVKMPIFSFPSSKICDGNIQPFCHEVVNPVHHQKINSKKGTLPVVLPSKGDEEKIPSCCNQNEKTTLHIMTAEERNEILHALISKDSLSAFNCGLSEKRNCMSTCLPSCLNSRQGLKSEENINSSYFSPNFIPNNSNSMKELHVKESSSQIAMHEAAQEILELNEVSVSSVPNESTRVSCSNLIMQSTEGKPQGSYQCDISKVLPNQNVNDSEDLKDTALKELEKQGKPGAPSKSTLIIHSVQREIIQPTMKVKMDKSGNWQEISEPETSGPDSLEASPASRQSKDSHSSHPDSMSSSVSKADDDDRSRPKEKKTFIGTLRKRLSFRKPRSKSAEIKQVESASMYSQGSNRSASSDRVKHIALSRETASLKSARRFLAVPGGSTRSSLSEASGLSTSSTRTYINENSTLVVETNENGIIKRYLIPPVLINRSKWRKRGLKLHIYNEHTFIAKHFSGSTICQVCKKALSRRPGKQGYICRDCSLQCHKSCHVKVPEFCPSSTTSSMEVEYECDPALAKKKK